MGHWEPFLVHIGIWGEPIWNVIIMKMTPYRWSNKGVIWYINLSAVSASHNINTIFFHNYIQEFTIQVFLVILQDKTPLSEDSTCPLDEMIRVETTRSSICERKRDTDSSIRY